MKVHTSVSELTEEDRTWRLVEETDDHSIHSH